MLNNRASNLFLSPARLVLEADHITINANVYRVGITRRGVDIDVKGGSRVARNKRSSRSNILERTHSRHAADYRVSRNQVCAVVG